MKDEEKKAVEIMIEAAKDTEYLEDAMLLGYRALKEHKYPKPPEIDMSKVETRTMSTEYLGALTTSDRAILQQAISYSSPVHDLSIGQRIYEEAYAG